MVTDEQLKAEFPTFEGNLDHLRKLLEGVDAWNTWRSEAKDERPHLVRLDLSAREELALGSLWLKVGGRWNADLHGARLENANLENADLSDARLEKANLSGARLEKADLSGARLEKANLSGAHLENANLADARLENADLSGARLENANLSGAHLENANLLGARLESAILADARLENADLSGARLENANLSGAHLELANLSGARLKTANLSGAWVKGSIWHQADLSGADLRLRRPKWLQLKDRREEASLLLDDTRILNARFAPGSQDPWSVVRSAYSGPALLFNLLFLLLFLVPHISRAGYWKGVNAAQEASSAVQVAADNRRQQSEARLQQLASSPGALAEAIALWNREGLDIDRGRQVIEEETLRLRDQALASIAVRTLTPVNELGLCLEARKNCGSPQPIWRPLVGLHQPGEHLILRLLAVALILYNISRGILTYYVSGLRDAETRGGYSPRLAEYFWVYRLHAYFLQYVPIAGLTAAVFQIAEWLLTTDVVLPVS